MQNIIIDKPYVFVPPYRGTWWPWFLQRMVPGRLRKQHGIVSVECQGKEKLLASYAAGHGILLAPNHSRPVDPETVNELCRQTGVLPYFLASWHLFMQGRFKTFMLRRLGAFSIYREGMDRAALKAAVEILETSSRPLVMFAEGYVSRTNDYLNPLQEGTSFIARSAAKNRAKATPAGQVVVHPIALRYRYDGDVRQSVEPVLTEIEARLSWRPQKQLSLEERIAKVGQALLSLKEIEHLGQPQAGTIPERLARLMDGLLAPLEKEWLKAEKDSDAHPMVRVRKLRAAILPDMAQGEITEAERARRWEQLANLYLVQQLSCYPPDYLAANPTPDRLLETVERYEEDLTDVARIHSPMRVTIMVGDAIVVSTARERGGEDPLVANIVKQLKSMLGINA
ncbi:MAG: 1-acyl-sn-glycerol-3-phosphate acyltransferase [Gemmataceae bacterium]|nr:1-acyl-sn-glycerol-3-phosphate acyltransferase [Gemmataceae bacterium]